MSFARLVLPDFRLIIFGWVRHHRLGFSKDFFTGLEKWVYYVLFLALLFQSILKHSLRQLLPATRFVDYRTAGFGFCIGSFGWAFCRPTLRHSWLRDDR
jgi:predicted permease